MQRKRKRQMYYRPSVRPGRRRPRFDFSGFLRRARWRLEDLAHSLPALPMPRRRRRYRVANRRRFMIAQGVLALTAVVALVMAGSVIVRSIRTARLNRQLVVMHTVTGDAMTAQIAAPPVGDGFESEAEAETASHASSSPYGELSAMVMPDGTPIEVEPVTAETEDTAQTGRTFRRTNLDVLPDMQKLVAANPDTMGWLSIAGTVHLPVVYRDNVFYLDHDFTGAKNASGTLFLDESSPMNTTTQNLLIHGHSMNDGSMFGILTHYRKLSYLKEHGLISFSTRWEKETYAVLAVMLVSSNTQDANYFNYFSFPNFDSDAAFEAYIHQVEAHSMYDIPVSAAPTDALLTLSTCIDDDRLVVVARRLRPEETEDEIISAVEQAYAL